MDNKELTVVYQEAEDVYRITEIHNGEPDFVEIAGEIVRAYLSDEENLKAQARLYLDARRAIWG